MKHKINLFFFLFFTTLIVFSCTTGTTTKNQNQQSTMKENQEKPLIAKKYYSGFPYAHDTYNAISEASDGKIYYVLSSKSLEEGGRMYCYDPSTDKTSFILDLTEACGEKGKGTVPQGKSHCRFYEYKGKLYFSTHTDTYDMINGMECMPTTPTKGYKMYPGGHILSYDLKTGKSEDLALAPNGDAFVTMTMDTANGQICGVSWPNGYLLHYDLKTGKIENIGKIAMNGEAGTPGKDYRVLCRSLLVDPRDGLFYFSNPEGDIFSYTPGEKEFKKLQDVNLRLDYFGKYDPTDPGTMGYNWRSMVWYGPENVAYGTHGNSGYLFRFDPQKQKIELVERITSEDSKKSGMFDTFSYGYLGFELGPDGKTLYYLTGGPIYENGERVSGLESIKRGDSKGPENLHLITYNIPERKYIDHGSIFYEDGTRPSYVNSIAVGPNGNVYTLARFEHDGKEVEDLIKIPNPFLQAQSHKVEKNNSWKELFDGKTLKGWKVLNQDFDNPESKPDFYVKDGMIICNTTMENKGGGYMVTEGEYDNFILELDVKIDSTLNSGVQCRSQVWDKETTTTYLAGNAEGTKSQVKWRSGYVWGYQIEIDPSARAWSGGLYEPGNRGWLVTPAGNKKKQMAFNKTGWNHFKIKMDGNRIQTWVNNILIVDVLDEMSKSGFIGLQFHGAYHPEQNNKKSMWKNIRIKEL